MVEEKSICLKNENFKNEDKFIKNILYTSISIISNEEFETKGMKNKNIMFFLNSIIEKIGSVSMLGSRNLGNSLIGKINNLIEYYNNMFLLHDKSTTISSFRINYIRDSIKSNIVLDEALKNKYLKLLGNNLSDDVTVENLKLIKSSLCLNKYFDCVSDALYDNVSSVDYSMEKYDIIDILVDEYISLLTDFIGISVFEIKKIIRDSYRVFFIKKDETIFLYMFTRFAERYNSFNEYIVCVKMDKGFDERLVNSLKQSKSDNFIIFSKSGFKEQLESMGINSKKRLREIEDKYIDSSRDNNYFLYKKMKSKDIWHAIKSFRQYTIQPFIGSMLYSGIKVNMQNDCYIVVESQDNKRIIDEFKYHDDIFKPLSQRRIEYSNVFKRYVIKNNSNDINKIIDEAVQLLPYYSKSDSILSKFTNTWFALETLYRKSSNTVINGLIDYSSFLVADRMISGYIYVTASQIKYNLKNFKKYSNNFVENMFINYIEFQKYYSDKCDYLEWKFYKIVNMINNYSKVFDSKQTESKILLETAYHLRNKQFHGTKNSKLENISGYLYDIVNDTISFYIDYLDVFKDEDTNAKSLYNIIKNIKVIKESLLSNKNSNVEKVCILYDSIRKI